MLKFSVKLTFLSRCKKYHLKLGLNSAIYTNYSGLKGCCLSLMSGILNLDALKNQLLTVSLVKGDGIHNMIFGFLFVVFIEQIFSLLPQIKSWTQKYLDAKVQQVANTVVPGVVQKEKTANIFYKRFWPKQQQAESGKDTRSAQSYEVADILIELVAGLDNTKDLVCNKFYYVTHKNVITINPHVFFQIHKVVETDADMAAIEFEIFSNDWHLSDLQEWVASVVEDAQIRKTNKLGKKLYYFDELSPLRTRFTAGNSLAFQMVQFFTNKNLHNVFGPQFKLIRDRVEFFINREEWYREKGVPHTLGIMLHGPPGTGKTSCIKAIANTTKRHIVNIKLTKQTTRSQLQNLFYDSKLLVERGDGQLELLTIPCNKRIYVMEDIDCLSNVVLDRNHPAVIEQDKAEKNKKNPALAASEVSEHEKVTLAFLLNLFDGVLETPGRILVMSTNYPDRIDKALIRPGRVDISMNLGPCDAATVREMIEHAYDTKDFEGEFADGIWTPAEVNQILFNNIDNKPEAIRQLLKANAPEKKIEAKPASENFSLESPVLSPVQFPQAECKLCGENLRETDRELWKAHFREKHPGEKWYKGFDFLDNCSVCGRWFEDGDGLEEHIEKKHNGTPSADGTWGCGWCGDQFGSETSLTQHMIIHDRGVSNLQDVYTEIETEKREMEKIYGETASADSDYESLD